jgi:hypothetical protein
VALAPGSFLRSVGEVVCERVAGAGGGAEERGATRKSATTGRLTGINYAPLGAAQACHFAPHPCSNAGSGGGGGGGGGGVGRWVGGGEFGGGERRARRAPLPPLTRPAFLRGSEEALIPTYDVCDIFNLR